MKNNKPSRSDLEQLRLTQTREDIARLYDVSISTVRRWVQGYNLQRKRKDAPKPILLRSRIDSGITVIERAKRKLGNRLVETRLGYILDGRPVNVDDILRASNLV